MAAVVTVLKSGGEYGPEHVQAMQRQVQRWAPRGTEFLCLSDVPVPGVERIKLYHDFPGWWSKLEVFALGLENFLYTDLDNIFVGPMDDLLKPRPLTLQAGGWTALMHVPGWDERCEVWKRFVADSQKHITQYDAFVGPARVYRPFGDAGFIVRNVPLGWKRWEAELPGQVVNIVKLFGPPIAGRAAPRLHLLGTDARVILCGGPERRPWKLPGFNRLYWCQEDV